MIESTEASPPRSIAIRADAAEDTRELSYIQLANAVLRHRRWFAITAFLCTALGVGVAMLLPHQFGAVSRFIPTTAESISSRLTGVAAQFGLGAALGAPGQSPDFYVALLTSREILEEAAADTYSIVTEAGESRSGTYVELNDIDGDTPDEVRLHTLEHLRDHLRISASPSTSLVTMEVRAEWPALAERLNRRLLELANAFNIQRRQTQAAAERQFTERRLSEAEQSLHEAEDALEQFLLANRTYQTSPQLLFEFGRLQRQVDLRQQVVESLTQAHEQARIDEVRNTPLITVVERPEGSSWPIPVRRVFAAIALIVGIVLGLCVVVVREYARRHGEYAGDELQEFKSLRRAAMADINPLTWFGGRNS